MNWIGLCLSPAISDIVIKCCSLLHCPPPVKGQINHNKGKSFTGSIVWQKKRTVIQQSVAGHKISMFEGISANFLTKMNLLAVRNVPGSFMETELNLWNLGKKKKRKRELSSKLCEPGVSRDGVLLIANIFAK